MGTHPDWWTSRPEHIDAAASSVRTGRSSVLVRSAGHREVTLFEYGPKAELRRQANYGSAAGAGDLSCYADKTSSAPVVLLVGGIHGGEMDAIVALLHFIHVLETGVDGRGKRHDYIFEHARRLRFLLIPCMNPDGRARVPFDSFSGQTMETMRYYMQGTWKDGTLCGYPDCKKAHPIREHVDFLGAYFNDDGVNMMHDQFFEPFANETKALLRLAADEAPDMTVLLHSGGNGKNGMLPTHYIPHIVKQRLHRLDVRLDKRSSERGLPYISRLTPAEDGMESPPPSFNLASAVHHVCGGASVVYETSMGLDAGGIVLSADEILDAHFVLFEELIRDLLAGDNGISIAGAAEGQDIT